LDKVAGIIAICDMNENYEKEKLIYNVFRGMQLLQHRGKAFWKVNSGHFKIEGDGSLPSYDLIYELLQKQKNKVLNTAIGYLSKKKPKHEMLKGINFASDGFFIDIDKLPTHPLIKNNKDIEHMYQIYFIFIELLLERNDPYKAAEFLDRHLRGNMVISLDDVLYVYRNSTGFKPLFLGEDKREQFFIVISENYVENFYNNLRLREINPGQLISIDLRHGMRLLTQLDRNRILMDPFEFVRDSHASSIFNNMSMYSIRKNIGKLQADFLAKKNVDIELIYAEPDYARPMALGFNLEYKNKNKNKVEMFEGVIKDRYDDSDHMIDYSEQVSKNKLLSNGKTLKFIIEPLTNGKNITSIQGTIQTGGTIVETIFYLKKSNAKDIDIIVSYVPTIDGRQVGLYTQQRDLIARKYIGKISDMDELNNKIAKDLGATSVFYNSSEILSKGIGVHESQLWFPEWIRFLFYK
jgi:amidophosphoribosyltransferase